MTSKERVHMTLERQSTDRVPIFMWYHPQTTKRPGNLLEIPANYVPLAMGDDKRRRKSVNEKRNRVSTTEQYCHRVPQSESRIFSTHLVRKPRTRSFRLPMVVPCHFFNGRLVPNTTQTCLALDGGLITIADSLSAT